MTAHGMLLLPLLTAACEVPAEGGSDKGSGDELCTFEEVDPVEQGWTEDQVSRATAAMQALPGSWSGNIACDDESQHPFRIDVQLDEEAPVGFQALTEDTRATCDTSKVEFMWTTMRASVELDSALLLEMDAAEAWAAVSVSDTTWAQLCAREHEPAYAGGCIRRDWIPDGTDDRLKGWSEQLNGTCHTFEVEYTPPPAAETE